MLLVGNVDWKAPTRPRVLTAYMLDDLYRLEVQYTIRLDGGSCVVVGARGLGQPNDRVIHGQSGPHRYMIVVAYRPFRPRNHTIKKDRSLISDGGYIIDGGKNARTSVGGLPGVEIAGSKSGSTACAGRCHPGSGTIA